MTTLIFGQRMSTLGMAFVGYKISPWFFRQKEKKEEQSDQKKKKEEQKKE